MRISHPVEVLGNRSALSFGTMSRIEALIMANRHHGPQIVALPILISRLGIALRNLLPLPPTLFYQAEALSASP